jgi:hypothetical protein
MSSQPTRLVSLRVSESDYAKLEQQSAALGLKPAVLARVLIRSSLNAPARPPHRHTRRQVAAVLDRIDKRVATTNAAPIDAVALIHRARDERDEQLAGAIVPRAATD